MTDVDRNTDSASLGEIAAPTPAPPSRSQVNWLQAAAHVAEIVGVVVVIASLFFLSAQVQQNTTQLRRADLNATHEHWSAVRLFLAGNRDHAAFWSASLNGAELDPPDQLRFGALMTEHARIAFQIWDRNRSVGIESGDFARSAAPPLARLLCTAGGGRWWSQFRQEFPRDFVEEMNAALASMLAGPGSGDPAHPCVDPNAPPPPAVQNG
jgi:hypothetical protein